MKRGGLAAIVTILFALLAAAAVFLYVQNVRQDAKGEQSTVSVIVAVQDVPAGQDLDPLIEEGAFQSKEVARSDLVQGVITDVYQLQGQRTAYPILAGEQIPAARLAGPLQAAGGILGIPPGMHAASIDLEGQRAIAGAIREGDHVEVFVTLGGEKATTTRVVIADTEVLATSAGAESTGSSSAVSVTLAVTPEQASHLIYAKEEGRIWLTLLPPNEGGVELPPVTARSLR